MPPASRLLYDKFIDNPLYAGTAKLFTNALLNVLVPEQLCEELLKISPRVYAELVEAVKTMLEVKHAGRSYSKLIIFYPCLCCQPALSEKNGLDRKGPMMSLKTSLVSGTNVKRAMWDILFN